MSEYKTSYILKLALLTIVMFWVSTILMLYSFKPEIFLSSIQSEMNAPDITAQVIQYPGQESLIMPLFMIYDQAALYSSRIIAVFSKFLEILKERGLTNDFVNTVIIFSFPYFISLFIFMMLASSMHPERLLVGSVTNSLVIGFTIIFMIVFNYINVTEWFLTGTELISSYAIINSFIFLVLFFLIGMIFSCFDEEQYDRTPNSAS